MARLHYDRLETVLSANLTDSATSISFSPKLTAASGDVPTLTGSDYIPLVIENEIVYLTAYTEAATTGTISRGEEGTSAAGHTAPIPVFHGITVQDVASDWTTFTPTFTNVTLGSGAITYGYYVRIGDLVSFQAGFKLGTGGSVSGFISVEGPLTVAALSGATFGPGAVTLYASDNSVTLRYVGSATPDENTTTWAYRLAGGGGTSGWTSGTPFTWTVDDELHVSGTIRVQ